MSVRFRFNLDPEKAPEKLIQFYSSKWKDLLRTVFHKRVSRTPDDYNRLAKISEELPRDFKLLDVIDKISLDNPEGAMVLQDCVVLFDVAPYDMRIFSLCMLGYKPQN